jgi:hypothetical protein
VKRRVVLVRATLAGLLVAELWAGGCYVDKTFQADRCMPAASTSPCPDRGDPSVAAALLDRGACGDNLVSVDEGPVFAPNATYVEGSAIALDAGADAGARLSSGPACCYLVTLDESGACLE